MNRRKLILGAGAGLVTAGVAVAASNRAAFYSLITEDHDGGFLDAPTAFEKVQSGEIVLVDIRRPDEWEKTGSPKGSVTLDMRREDFTDELKRVVDGKTDAPIAVICARGVRSARLTNRLIEAGFTNILDVPEGMLGSAAGPGWLERGLPLDGV